MTTAFVDTHYFIALFQKTDQWHSAAIRLENEITDYNFVTTDSVLVEVLNYFSAYGAGIKKSIATAISALLEDPRFLVIEQTRDNLLQGINLYRSRLDKGYSVTDCISMNVCREVGIAEVLTNDAHFSQEGFRILL